MSGVCLGKGGSARCRVSALRVTLFGTKLHIDCQHVIEWVSQSIPEGMYELSIEGKTFEMRYSEDGWQAVQVRALLSSDGARKHGHRSPVRKRRKISATARKRIADGQRKRWAEQKAAANK